MIGEDPETFKRLGILIDKEESECPKSFNNFLLQIFSCPLFTEDTFFLEIIHRHGMEGFGAGNVKALAQSVLEFQNQQNAKSCEKMKIEVVPNFKFVCKNILKKLVESVESYKICYKKLKLNKKL